jgi:hypothetical protein
MIVSPWLEELTGAADLAGARLTAIKDAELERIKREDAEAAEQQHGHGSGGGLSLAYARPRLYASSQLFECLFTTAEATTLIAAHPSRRAKYM